MKTSAVYCMTVYGDFVNNLHICVLSRAIGHSPIRPGGMAMQAYAMPFLRYYSASMLVFFRKLIPFVNA